MIVLVHKKPGPGYKWVQKLLFAPDSRTLLTGGQIGGHLWSDLPATDKRRDFSDIQWVSQMQFASRGELFTRGGAGAFRSIKLTTLESRHPDMPSGGIEHFDVSPNRRAIVFVARQSGSGREPETNCVRCSPVADLSEGAVRWSHDISGYAKVWCLDNNRYLLRASGGGLSRPQYTIGSLKTGAMQREVGENDWFGARELVSPDGRFFVVERNAQLIAFSTTDLSKPLALLKNATRKLFTDIAFHPSGKYLGATSNDATVKLYDTNTWEVAHTFTWKIGRMHSIAFSPDGALAAAGSDKGQVVVWDVDL